MTTFVRISGFGVRYVPRTPFRIVPAEPLGAAVGDSLAIAIEGTDDFDEALLTAAPPFGTPDAAIHKHVAPRYIADSIKETGIPNVVTAVLASYRGYDTLGEVIVIFTAGLGVLALLGYRKHGKKY